MTQKYRTERFRGISYSLDINKLERETQKLLFLGILVAIAFHAAIGAFFMYKKTEVKVVKPPTMELVIRKPRMTKPFELRKERPKQREYKRRAVYKRIIPTAEVKPKRMPEFLMGKVTSFEYSTEIHIGDENVDSFVPVSLDIELTTVRKPGRQISMKEELITIDDLDTGQYKAMVIQDPHDKKNIKGFIYIATLWGTLLEPAYKRAIIHLSDSINKHTKISSKVDQHLFIDSRELFETPFVYLCVTERFELTEIEEKNFGEYLRNGGFAVLDNGLPEESLGPAEASLRWMLRCSLGNDAIFMPIPNDHPLYHCFFDFNVPPIGGENDPIKVGSIALRTNNQEPVYYLEGIWIKDRLVAIYCDKGYGRIWESDYNNEPQLKMGVNMVVYALIQQGGIAERKMEIYSTVQ